VPLSKADHTSLKAAVETVEQLPTQEIQDWKTAVGTPARAMWESSVNKARELLSHGSPDRITAHQVEHLHLIVLEPLFYLERQDRDQVQRDRSLKRQDQARQQRRQARQQQGQAGAAPQYDIGAKALA
jgi:hypothetical protein